MPTVRFLQNVFVSGELKHKIGQQLQLEEPEASKFVRRGWAESLSVQTSASEPEKDRRQSSKDKNKSKEDQEGDGNSTS